jgi:tetratricopeptide (TPR) repeat protein
LAGVTRILNPGREFADFQPGQRLEDFFTVYVRAGSRPFKVISHAEQLALSKCAKESGGRLWCGTCHNPHPPAATTLATYNSRCEGCHAGKLPKEHPTDDGCVTCHMSRRPAQDGGHTVFTDHRIRRAPEPDEAAGPVEDIAVWREPDPALRQRNLALAYVNSGISNRTPEQIVRGYRMLTEVQKSSPDDTAVLRAIGRVLLLGKEPREALRAFDRVLELDHNNARSEEDAGVACLEAGQVDQAASHLQRALALDPLLLTAATALEEVYRKQGEPGKASALANRIERDLRNPSRATR